MLNEDFRIGTHLFPNRVVLQPMEGCDCYEDGSPSELTMEKYRRAAKSGAGLIWFEANAACPEGRTNPRQMMLTVQNAHRFASFLKELREIALAECGILPVFILQLTHSGRQSITPMIVYHHPLYEQRRPASDANIVSDEYLDALPEKYAASARLALEVGFDGVDVKSCHGYLLQELLSAFLYEKCGRKVTLWTPQRAEMKKLCDMILVMTVEPGYGGQKLIPECLDKVAEIRAEANRRGIEIDIQVDGGINPENAPAAVKCGANVLVAGSSVFKASDRKAAIDALR